MQTWRSPHNRPLPPVGGRTLVMGILNVTPDSFSDGGELRDVPAVVDRAAAMIAAGADVLDLGGESTRPGAAAVTEAEERARVVPAIRAVRARWPDVPVSIDTFKAGVAEAAIEAGADIVNDVWGCLHGVEVERRATAIEAIERAAPETGSDRLLPGSPMAETAARLGCPLILMHNRPDRNYGEFWTGFVADLQLSIAVAMRAGVPRPQLWTDPGFGFAKTPAQNLEVLKHLERVVALGFPVLVGTSRKSTIGRVLGTTVDDRIEGTAATMAWAIERGAAMIRVHDVAAMARVARMTDAIKAGLEFELGI